MILPSSSQRGSMDCNPEVALVVLIYYEAVRKNRKQKSENAHRSQQVESDVLDFLAKLSLPLAANRVVVAVVELL